MESFSNNLHIVSENLLRVFDKLFCLRFYVSSKSGKEHCVAKILQGIWQIFLYENNCNCKFCKFSYKFAFILFFCSFEEIKNNNQSFTKLVAWQREIFLFFFIANRVLLQRYAAMKWKSVRLFCSSKPYTFLKRIFN